MMELDAEEMARRHRNRLFIKVLKKYGGMRMTNDGPMVPVDGSFVLLSEAERKESDEQRDLEQTSGGAGTPSTDTTSQ